MLYRYTDLINKYGNNYQIRKKISLGRIIKRDDGLYSDQEEVPFTDVIVKKYPKAVITDLTAYYCYNLYDINPPVIHVATKRDTTKITNSMINQHFVTKSIYKLGVVSLTFNNKQVKIYDKEKLLIELIRNKDKYSSSQYNKILNNYKQIIKQLDYQKIINYLEYYPNSRKLKEKIESMFK